MDAMYVTHPAPLNEGARNGFHIDFRVLGAVEAARDGVPLALGGQKQRAVLGILLANIGRHVSADEIVDEVWRDAPPRSVKVSLHSYVSRLRTQLGDKEALRRRGSAYCLCLPRCALDAARFEQAADEGFADLRRGRPASAVDHFDRALDMWVGSPFADLHEYAFARHEADRLGTLRLTVLEERAGARLRLRDAGADPLLRQAWEENPMRERLAARLMYTLYADGRQAEAVEVFRQTRSRLVEELGLDVSPELSRAHLDIIRRRV